MDLNRNTMKKLLALVAFGILLLVGLQNLPAVFSFVWAIYRLLLPFLLGLCVAFILNVPMRFIERILFRSEKPEGFRGKLRRPVSLAITVVLVAGIVFVVMFLIVPEIGRTFQTLADHIPAFIAQVQTWATGLITEHPEWADWMTRLQIDWKKLSESLVQFLSSGAGSLLNSTVSVATSVLSGLVNFFLGIIFAFYVLMQKETLGRQCRRVLYAYLPEKRADRIVSIASLANRTFSNFLSGQCVEACILGTLMFIALSIFRFPYALLISVLTAVTALIPIFGAIIAWITGGFLILMINPLQALWFVILFQVVQQIEGNLIYPHVVGTSVNLPSIWVLVAVTLGGSLMGVSGMLLFIPLCSVLYALSRELVGRRIRERRIPEEKLLKSVGAEEERPASRFRKKPRPPKEPAPPTDRHS